MTRPKNVPYMMIGTHRHQLEAICVGCKKRIMHPSTKCYTCATGLPRTILRPEEREAAAA